MKKPMTLTAKRAASPLVKKKRPLGRDEGLDEVLSIVESFQMIRACIDIIRKQLYEFL